MKSTCYKKKRDERLIASFPWGVNRAGGVIIRGKRGTKCGKRRKDLVGATDTIQSYTSRRTGAGRENKNTFV